MPFPIPQRPARALILAPASIAVLLPLASVLLQHAPGPRALAEPNAPLAQAQAQDPLADAVKAYRTGKYATAEERFRALVESPDFQAPERQVRLAVGVADTLRARGELDEAERVLNDARAKFKDAADPVVPAKLADLALFRGRWDDAESLADQALAADPDHVPARWVKARLLLNRGEREAAVDACRWFVDHQNANPAVDRDPDLLVIVGQAAEIYYRAIARGQELAETLNDVINQIYERALRLDPDCWEAAWLEGRLFLAGYNERLALPELERAIRVNPLAVEAIVTLGRADLNGYKLAAGRKKAERALEINPAYHPALVLLADLNISDERFEDALAAAAKAVEINPNDEDALARLAAAKRLVLDHSGAGVVELHVLANNPRPATFYAALGERLADRRKYPEAERAFLKAVAADPENADARVGLGMLFMQVGREEEADALFAAAFEADPFNVRADNMMRVLKHLADYETVVSDNYEVLVDPSQDALIGKYMSRYLEKVHGELVETFQFAPPLRTRVEILKTHQWFSGRTIGLPFIPTVGACTGKVVALASPRATRQPFNWARVLKHEVVHVITLQQTEFNIPHWYTEALAVQSEGYPRPQEWNKMLVRRVPARKLLDLDTINLGFIRPSEPEERQLAYCQAQLYAQYMLERFGPDSLARMLEAYRRGLTTTRAVESCFNVPKDDFEKGYLAFLDAEVKRIASRVEEEERIPFSQLEARLKANPDDPELNARMAYEHFSRRDLKEARPFADKALRLKPGHPLASYVKARLLGSIGDDAAAIELLRAAHDPENPNDRVVDLLAELEMKAGNLDVAEALYEAARQRDPVVSKWIAGLGRVHLRQKRMDKFREDLEFLAMNDADDLALRKKLVELFLEAGDFEKAERWGWECLYIQVYDPDCHVMLADALAGGGKWDEAIEEYDVALTLEPKKPDDIRVKLARAVAGGGDPGAAAEILRDILAEDPDHPEAKALLQTLPEDQPPADDPGADADPDAPAPAPASDDPR